MGHPSLEYLGDLYPKYVALQQSSNTPTIDWDVKTWEDLDAFKDAPNFLFWIQRYHNHSPWQYAENIISTDARLSYRYAVEVVKGRWVLGETAIKLDIRWSSWYAFNVIKGRWIEQESLILLEPEWTLWYTINVVGQPWPRNETPHSLTLRRDILAAYSLFKHKHKHMI